MFNYADSLAIAFVTAVYPEGQSIDALLSDDGSRLSNVQVMVPTGSSDTGMVDLPDPGLPADESRWNFNTNPARFLRAIIAFHRGIPVCLGFLLPQITQVTFQQKNRRIMRHASDVYTTIDQHGNTELYHPSGVYLRIGTSSAHEDLTGQDFDQSWAITKNLSPTVHVHLGGPSGMSLDVDPTGNVRITAPSVELTTTQTITGDERITGGLTVGAGASGTFTTPSGLTVTVQDGIVTNIF
jgi:hypothetical protein